MPNIEIKAHFPSLEKGREIARNIHAKHVGLDHQIDTYFKTQAGRFKLRESSLSGAYLIPYMRSDQQGPKKSDYVLLQVSDPSRTKKLFKTLLGIECVVEKNRDIYMCENVRIHLDEVKGLGNFFELEAVYTDESPESIEREHLKVHELMNVFSITPDLLIEGSYREKVGT